MCTLHLVLLEKISYAFCAPDSCDETFQRLQPHPGVHVITVAGQVEEQSGWWHLNLSTAHFFWKRQADKFQHSFGAPIILLLPFFPQIYEEMPYQLVAAVAGLCLEAGSRSARQAILIIHQFRTSLTEDAKIKLNDEALERFFKHLAIRNAHSGSEIRTGVLSGPVKMRSGSFNAIPFPSGIQLLLGKIRTGRKTRALDQVT
jgi:hypothetical protein